MGTRSGEIRDKLLVFAVITGLFLPVRMFFYAFLSSHWIGSLGMISSIMLLLTFLAHKQRLGWFGEIFITQITKTMKGKSGLVTMGISLVMMAYLGSTLVWIERGDTIYSDEKTVISQMIFSKHDPSQVQIRGMDYKMQVQKDSPFFLFSRFDQVMSMTYAIMNDRMGGWLVNLDTVLLVEQFEVLGMIFFYRKVCTRYFQNQIMAQIRG